MPSPGRHGSSLTELLFALVLVAVLASLLLGASGRIVTSMKATKCLGKLQQLGVAAHLFIGENSGTLPYTATSTNWMQNLAPYLGVQTKTFTATSPLTDALLCPDDPARSPRQRRTYRFNQTTPSDEGAREYGRSNVTPSKFAQIARPPTHAMFFCVAYIGSDKLGLWTFTNALWKESAEPLYPQGAPGAVFTRPHYEGRAVNILYSDGHAAMTPYPLKPEVWHFDGR